jgi:uncharacterized caspase-like protein
MTPQRLAEALRLIRWSGSILAKAVDVRASVVDQWLSGTQPVPHKVAAWIEALCFVHEAAENSTPTTAGAGYEGGIPREHIPLHSYHLLRALREGPVKLRQLFGTEDEAAVFFLLSRALATRDGEHLVITTEGRAIGEVAQ